MATAATVDRQDDDQEGQREVAPEKPIGRFTAAIQARRVAAL